MEFNCGHTQTETPRNMGRGAARKARLVKFFDRNCLQCRLAAEAAFEASLTIPRSPEKAAAVRKQIEMSYL